jgi:hypothetical protein
MHENTRVPSRSHLQKLLIDRRNHWDHDGYDPNARREFLRALQCKTSELGRRVYGSQDEEREFCNTCKSRTACSSCGFWATMQWLRKRKCALPECDYLAITFTMADTLWPLFADNPHLCRKLPEIAARVLMNYARVRKGAEIGVMPILQTFNGKLQFNPHVHALVTAGDLLTVGSQLAARVYFVDIKLTRSWQRLVIALLRRAMESGQLKSGMARDEVDHLLQQEEKRAWAWTHVHADTKEHFLDYGGRYAMRPPISENRVLAINNGFVQFWYNDKKTLRRETVFCKAEEFIDRWAQHMPQRYQHSVGYFGLFGPRRWARVAAAVFAILGREERPRPKRLPWSLGIQQLGSPNPLLDRKGQPMRFVRHLAPTAI